jgi:hypothetical protein
MSSTAKRISMSSNAIIGSNDRRRFAWPLLAAAVARLAMIPFAHVSNPWLWEYGDIARNMIAGRGYSFTWYFAEPPLNAPSALMPPGETFLQYSFLKILGDGTAAYLSIFLIQVLCGVAFVFVIGAFVDRLFESERLKLIAMWSAALFPSFVYATATFGVASEILLLNALLMLAAFDLYRSLIARRGAVRSAFLLGISAGILGFFRSEAPLPVFVLLVLFVIAKEIAVRERLRAALIVGATFIAIMAPWSIRNYTVFHTFIPGSTTGGFNLWKGNHALATGSASNEEGQEYRPADSVWSQMAGMGSPEMFELHFSRVLTISAIDWIKAEPAKAAILACKKAAMIWTFDWYNKLSSSFAYAALSVGTIVLGFLGLLQYRNQRARLKFGFRLIAAFSVVYTLLAMVFFVVPRYQIFLVGVYWPFVVLGIDAVLARFRTKQRVMNPVGAHAQVAELST